MTLTSVWTTTDGKHFPKDQKAAAKAHQKELDAKAGIEAFWLARIQQYPNLECETDWLTDLCITHRDALIAALNGEVKE